MMIPHRELTFGMGVFGMLKHAIRLRNLLLNYGLMTFMVLCLLTVGGITGCSDSGGGGGERYQVTGYDGFTNTAGNASLDFFSHYPWFVNLTFQVSDADGNGVSDLTVGDFSVFEDGLEVSQIDSEMNIRKRYSLPSEYSYTLKTVLFLDNTPSVSVSLDKIKEAAQVVIDERDELGQQEFAIVAYDDAGDLTVVQDFTTNATLLYQHLAVGAADSIQPASGTTNFYGGVIDALALWEDNYSVSDTELVQGILIAITDGKDTSNLYDIEDAVAARKDKQVFTVSVGADIPEGELSDLERLGNAGFYHVTEPDREPDENYDKKENLCETLQEVQKQIRLYADAFYWLQYKSQQSNGNHVISLSIDDNNNKESNATISGSFNSDEFFTGEDGVYFEASAANPDGISELVVFIEKGEAQATESIKAVTITGNTNNPSQYEWKSGNENIVMLGPDDKDSAYRTISAVAPGETTITVTDTANNLSNVLKVKVQIKAPSYEFLKYVVDSSTPWFVAATFNVRKTDSENNIWTWVDDLIREDFSVQENGALIDNEISEVNLRKRNAIPSDFNYSLKTVLLIDNSPSIGSDNLDLIKDAAKAFVFRALQNDPADNSDFGPLLADVDDEESFQQEIAIWTYTEDGDSLDVWQDFTSDFEVLEAAIDALAKGFGPTNFYGGMIDALSMWKNDLSPWDVDNTLLQQGVVIALSDGNHSLQGFYDRESVLDQIKTKQVITVGVGDDLISSVNEDLEAFGTAGFYSVPDPGQEIELELISDVENKKKEKIVTSLEKTLMDIQDSIFEYANSFYWLDYKSYVQPAANCIDKEKITIKIKDNANSEPASMATGQFESCDFFDGIDGKIYLNPSSSNPAGITDSITFRYFIISNIVYTASDAFELEALTYKQENRPDYEWLVSNENIIEIDVDESSYGNSRAVLKLPENPQAGSAILQVIDNGNGGSFLSVIINVELIGVLNPVLFYPFDGNAEDRSGNGYDGMLVGPTLTADRYGNSQSAYSFDGNDYIAIRDFYYGDGAGSFSDTLDQITVSAWFRSVSARTVMHIIDFDPDEYWGLLFRGGNLSWDTYNPTDGSKFLQPAQDSYLDGEWHNACATFDRNTGLKELYIDGRLVGTELLVEEPLGRRNPRFGFVGAGSETSVFNGDRNPKIQNFQGEIDDVMIFDQVLTPEQIELLFTY